MRSGTYGGVSVTWGANRWVLVDAPHGSAQRQIDRQDELVAMLGEVGLLRGDAERVATAAWADRPGEAHLPLESAWEPQYRTAGMSQGTYLLLLLAGLVVFAVWYGLRL